MASFLGVPVLYRGKPVGNLYLANRPGGAEFSANHEHLVRMLAARVGAAIETVTLYAGATREHAWLQAVVDQMPDAVIVYDELGRVRAANQASVPLSCALDDRRDPFGNCILLDLRELDESPLTAERWPLVRILRGHEGIVREELLARLSTGKLCPVALSAGPVLSKDGKITGAMLILQDISEHKELERLREQWAAVVAHDLRQPVHAICLDAEALLHRGGARPERDVGALERIVSASKRLDRMINDLLDASRIESNQLTIERRTVTLCPLVESVVADFARSLSGHAVRVRVAPELRVSVDPDRMHQVLGNLVSNASKYASPDSEIRIDAAAHDGAVEVTVTNCGAGIAPDQARLLFGRFLRLPGRRAGWGSGSPTGIGLGLYIAKGLVEAHGGRIWVESTPGEETRFHFTVPAGSPQTSAPRPTASR